ncbi:hypothetical protein [Methyloterricola oryzae]|uniref:hypothetical protein n=1 Tax=Methyloterricola oryzae TaxID=1495050 RepID=UPI001300F21D|nr:hypothetical protein [Methyloterricola oryzae]
MAPNILGRTGGGFVIAAVNGFTLTIDTVAVGCHHRAPAMPAIRSATAGKCFA